MLIVNLSWDAPSYKDMTETQREVFEANWPGMKSTMDQRRKTYANKPEEIDGISKWEYGSRQRLTMQEVHNLHSAGIMVQVEAVDGTMLQPNKTNGEKHDKYGDIHPLDLSSGAVVQIAVPDIGLLQIGEVDWIEDACTQELQGKLDDGWRILAVCPPNAQRRPDYILGRAKRDRD